jgi:mono/diheme cytochrome c family protein
MMTSSLLTALTGLALAAGPEETELARKAQAVLQAACHRCHGQDGANEGGFSAVLDRDRLVAAKKVVPGDPSRSPLFKRVQSGEMPPEDEKPRPSPEDVAVLTRWIEAGAPSATPPAAARKPIAPAEIYELMSADLKKANERDRRFLRYFSLCHLYNAGWAEDELDSYRVALSKLVNSLSWGRKIVRPTPIDKDRTVFRVDLRDYKWSERVWELIAGSYPYGLQFTTSAARYCVECTGTALPCVRADWFVAAASKPPLYHEVLQLPATDTELERLLRIDVEEDIRQERVVRAAFNGSGVSRSNRLIERHESPYGAYWKSYDFAASSGRQNVFAYPLGPGGDDCFQHDGGEIIFTLPNGLHGYMLTDAKGNRLDKGPISIVSDPKQPDRSVVNGISCMSCHTRGVIEKYDQVRESVQKNRTAFAKKDVETILALYPPKPTVERLFREDEERYAKAVAEAGGRTRDGKVVGSDPVVSLTMLFERDMDLTLTVAESGVRLEVFLKALEKSPELARALGALKVEGGTIPRQQFVLVFKDLAKQLEIGVVITAGGDVPGLPPVPRADDLRPVRDPAVLKLLDDLKGSNNWARRDALTKLAEMQPQEGREQVALALEALLADKDVWVRGGAIKALGTWGTPKVVPSLHKFLESKDLRSIHDRRAVLESLAKLKDPRSVGPVAEQLRDFHARGEAIKTLIALGPQVEKEMIKLLAEKDGQLGAAACQVLKVVGTRASLPALRAAIDRKDFWLSGPAKEALDAILARMNQRSGASREPAPPPRGVPPCPNSTDTGPISQ